jgi:L,D-transpeptidase ErfK/SrfK
MSTSRCRLSLLKRRLRLAPNPAIHIRRCLFTILFLAIVDAAAGADLPSVASSLTGGEFIHTVQRGESLTSIGARFGVETKFLAASNVLKPSSYLREGQQLRVDNRHIVPGTLVDGILINLPERMLFYFREGRLMRSYPVGLGRPDWPTPTGSFTIATKQENPVWKVPPTIQEEMRREGKMVQQLVPPGPDNPLGKHWLGLSIPGYGIHGTIAATSIYQFRTHGCIRLHPDDIAQMFSEVPLGVPGIIIYQPLLLTRLGNQLFLEVHRDIYRKEPNPLSTVLTIATANNLQSALDWEIAKEIIAKQEGVARDVTNKVAPNGINHESR